MLKILEIWSYVLTICIKWGLLLISIWCQHKPNSMELSNLKTNTLLTMLKPLLSNRRTNTTIWRKRLSYLIKTHSSMLSVLTKYWKLKKSSNSYILIHPTKLIDSLIKYSLLKNLSGWLMATILIWIRYSKTMTFTSWN